MPRAVTVVLTALAPTFFWSRCLLFASAQHTAEATSTQTATTTPHAVGFVWLVDGCSISLAVQDLTAAIVKHFMPDPHVHTLKCSELWKKATEIVSFDAGSERVGLVDLLSQGATNGTGHEVAAFCRVSGLALDAVLPKPTPQTPRPLFVVAKMESSLIADVRSRYADLDVAPPPFVLAAMMRSNVVEYVACLLRDRSAHGIDVPGSPIRNLKDLGYVVDASTGERVNDAIGVFRAGKDEYRAVLDASRLPELLSEVRSFQHVEKANALHDVGVPTVVYPSDDLINLNSETQIRAAAEIWLSLLARARFDAKLDDIVEYLRYYVAANKMGWRENYNTTAPCDLRQKIYNLDEVRTALKGTVWERYAYCSYEWSQRVG